VSERTGMERGAVRRPALVQLGEATRALMDAVVRTNVEDDVVTEATAAIVAATERLNASHREGTFSPVPDEVVERFNAYNPVVGKVNPFAPPMTVDYEADGRAVARVRLTRVHEGPPLAVHGGIVALIIDQLLGHAVATTGRPGMTVSLTIRYKRPTPYDTELLVEAWHTRIEGRKVLAEARITHDGNVTAEADAVFLTLTAEQRARYISRVVGEP
jgi:acyl-coenzyme A thioesterase PaaI-like protein